MCVTNWCYWQAEKGRKHWLKKIESTYPKKKHWHNTFDPKYMFYSFVVAQYFDKLIWIEDCKRMCWKCSTQLKFPLWLSHHCLVTVEPHLTFAKCHFHLLCTSLMPAFQKRHKFGSDRSFRTKKALWVFFFFRLSRSDEC